MAYRAGHGSYDVFLEWSRQHRDYQSDAYVREQWRSFASAHSVTAATLFAEVFDRFPGWKKPSERGTYCNGTAADDDWEDEPGAEADSTFEEEALPLSPEPLPAKPYPLEALGSLKGVIEDIAESVGCDPALTSQSVLMAAALATAGIANILLPKIGEVGLSLFFVTIAVSSERKSTSDKRALRGIKDRVKEIAAEHKIKLQRHKDEVRIYDSSKNAIVKDKKLRGTKSWRR